MGMVMLPGQPLVELIHNRYPELHVVGYQKDNPSTLKDIFKAIGICDRTYYRMKGPRGTVREDIADSVATTLGSHLDILYGKEWREDPHKFNAANRKAKLTENRRLVERGKKRCSKCGNVKPLGAYHKNAHAVGGASCWCKGCYRTYKATYRADKRAQNLQANLAKNVAFIAKGKKCCSKCGKVKPLTAYYTHPTKLGGVSNWCKDCHKTYNKGYSSAKRKKTRQATERRAS